jgi:hypothetical protein
MMKAKHISVLGKGISIIFLVSAYLITAITSKKIPSADEVFGQVQVALVIGGLFAPIDISMIVQNIKGIKDATKP